MLGIGQSLNSEKDEFDLLKVPNLIGWWDFTDKGSMWSDEGRSTRIADNDAIAVIDNKAYYNLPSSLPTAKSTLALGAFLQAPVAQRPRYVEGGGGYGDFYGGGGGTPSHLLHANKIKGNVATNMLSASTINTQNITWFVVFRSDDYASQPLTNLLHFECDDGGGTSTTDFFDLNLGTDEHVKFFAGDRSDKSGDVTMNSGEDLGNAFEIWTGVHTLASSASSRIYKNRDKTAGAINLTSKDHDYDFSSNQTSNYFSMGGELPGNSLLDGQIKEVILYNRTLSRDEVKNVEYYLAHKHKISI